jgi:hypothetical protein
MLASSYQTPFLADVRKATAASDLLTSFREGMLKPGYVLDDNLLFFDGALVIPSKDLQSQVLATCHDYPIGGHFGIAKTFELISCDSFGLVCAGPSVLTSAPGTLACVQKLPDTSHMDYSILSLFLLNAGTMSLSILSLVFHCLLDSIPSWWSKIT